MSTTTPDRDFVRNFARALWQLIVEEYLPSMAGTLQGQIQAHPGTPATPTSRGSVQLTGDLGGTSTSPVVTGVQSIPYSPIDPQAGQAYVWNGTQMAPADIATQAELAAATGNAPYYITFTNDGQVALRNDGLIATARI